MWLVDPLEAVTLYFWYGVSITIIKYGAVSSSFYQMLASWLFCGVCALQSLYQGYTGREDIVVLSQP